MTLNPLKVRHFLEVDDLTADELGRVLDLATTSPPTILAGRSVALYFAKPSLRTRHSCEAATARLGGHPVTFSDAEVKIGVREPAADVARVLSGYHALLGARVFEHELVESLAASATVPVINLLSDAGHPCQAIADLLGMRDEFGALEGRTVAYIGDFNNVSRSLCLAAARMGMRVQLGCPPGYGPSEDDIERMMLAGLVEAPLVTMRPHEAADGADAVHTDVWASMGQEDEAEARQQAFEGMQVDDSVMAAAKPGAIFMHCLPAHRGEEVSASVADGPQSRMIGQAHHRMTAMIGLLRWLDEVGSL